jgi:hypothetical protein
MELVAHRLGLGELDAVFFLNKIWKSVLNIRDFLKIIVWFSTYLGRAKAVARRAQASTK